MRNVNRLERKHGDVLCASLWKHGDVLCASLYLLQTMLIRLMYASIEALFASPGKQRDVLCESGGR